MCKFPFVFVVISWEVSEQLGWLFEADGRINCETLLTWNAQLESYGIRETRFCQSIRLCNLLYRSAFWSDVRGENSWLPWKLSGPDQGHLTLAGGCCQAMPRHANKYQPSLPRRHMTEAWPTDPPGFSFILALVSVDTLRAHGEVIVKRTRAILPALTFPTWSTMEGIWLPSLEVGFKKLD